MPPKSIYESPHDWLVITERAHPAGLVFSLPHSGRAYPDHFLREAGLTPPELKLGEDHRLDQLIAPLAKELKASFFMTHCPRLYVDLNRSEGELDPALIPDIPPAHPLTPTSKSQTGLGIIPRLIRSDMPLYPNGFMLSWGEAATRIENFYRPAHHALDQLCQAQLAAHGFCCLIDWHSTDAMPSIAATSQGKKLPQIVLGNSFGRSMPPALTDRLADLLRKVGFDVAINDPFAGGYICNHYGDAKGHQFALQIEIRKDLYLDAFSEIRPEISQLQQDLAKVFAQFARDLAKTYLA